MVWSRVNEGRGGHHQEDAECAEKENKGGRPKIIWLDNIRDDMKEYKMTEDMAEYQSVIKAKCVANKDKGRPFSTWRRPIGEKVRKT